MRFDASTDMNADDRGNGLATVVRIYQLQDAAGFLSLPHAVLLDDERERVLIGNALLKAREIILMPGEAIQITESIVDGASHLGIVAHFRKRSGQRWRLAFTFPDAAREGISIGVHACAMTASAAAPLGTSTHDALLLSTAPCR